MMTPKELFWNRYSVLDYEGEGEASAKARPCTPWAFACAVNNLNLEAKVEARAMFFAAWKKHVQKEILPLPNYPVKTWPVVLQHS